MISILINAKFRVKVEYSIGAITDTIFKICGYFDLSNIYSIRIIADEPTNLKNYDFPLRIKMTDIERLAILLNKFPNLYVVNLSIIYMNNNDFLRFMTKLNISKILHIHLSNFNYLKEVYGLGCYKNIQMENILDKRIIELIKKNYKNWSSDQNYKRSIFINNSFYGNCPDFQCPEKKYFCQATQEGIFLLTPLYPAIGISSGHEKRRYYSTFENDHKYPSFNDFFGGIESDLAQDDDFLSIDSVTEILDNLSKNK